MKKEVDYLFELQKLQLKGKGTQAERGAEIEALRKKIGAGLLVGFDRFIERGKKSVAIVRHGVCSECHLQIPRGLVMNLTSSGDVQRCGNCGRYLYLPPEETVAPAAPVAVSTATPAKSRRKSEMAHAH